MKSFIAAIALTLTAAPSHAYNIKDFLNASCDIMHMVIFSIAVEEEKGADADYLTELYLLFIPDLSERDARQAAKDTILISDPNMVAELAHKGCKDEVGM